MVDVLQKAGVLNVIVNRMFPNFSPDPLHKLKREQMRDDSDTEDAEPSHVYSASYGLDDIPQSEIFHYDEIESPDASYGLDDIPQSEIFHYDEIESPDKQ